MKTAFAFAGLLLALTASLGLAVPAAAAPPPLPGAVEVVLDQDRLSTVVGERLTVESRVVNSGDAPTDRLVAHLNVASLDGVYVDLEDWSADVTREMAAVPAGGSRSLSWEFQAVNTGSFDLYVVLMPNGASTAGSGPLVVSRPVHVTVAGKRTLTAAGSLPVAIVVPVLLGLVAAAARYRLRRTG
ncbi:hypothetical protein ABZV78_13490 [Micromonospora sp. NPDC004540]|uniref:hypothetical protein n=1 Tax=Micromonospora sp. NPDC004540 TaxID=3154457 RepID=UPI0033B8BA69